MLIFDLGEYFMRIIRYILFIVIVLSVTCNIIASPIE